LVRLEYHTTLTPRLCIMIVDRYDPMNLFALVPRLALEMDPELAALDHLLEDDTLFASG
jgi:hypothetical protein